MIKQAETRTVMRSEISFANYNPRKITPEARKKLKANLKKVGLLGGIVWNSETSRLVSGHQKVAIMDEVNKYDGGKNDYAISVQVVSLDEKSEKEQNVFMNSRSAQGTFDADLLRDLVSEIDCTAAGLDALDLNLLGVGETPKISTADRSFDIRDFQETHKAQKTIEEAVHSEEDRNIDRTTDFYEDTEENQIKRHAEVQKIKDRIRNNADTQDHGVLSYVVLSFDNPQQKSSFLEMMGYEATETYISGKEFSDRIEFGE